MEHVNIGGVFYDDLLVIPSPEGESLSGVDNPEYEQIVIKQEEYTETNFSSRPSVIQNTNSCWNNLKTSNVIGPNSSDIVSDQSGRSLLQQLLSHQETGPKSSDIVSVQSGTSVLQQLLSHQETGTNSSHIGSVQSKPGLLQQLLSQPPIDSRISKKTNLILRQMVLSRQKSKAGAMDIVTETPEFGVTIKMEDSRSISPVGISDAAETEVAVRITNEFSVLGETGTWKESKYGEIYIKEEPVEIIEISDNEDDVILASSGDICSKVQQLKKDANSLIMEIKQEKIPTLNIKQENKSGVQIDNVGSEMNQNTDATAPLLLGRRTKASIGAYYESDSSQDSLPTKRTRKSTVKNATKNVTRTGTKDVATVGTKNVATVGTKNVATVGTKNVATTATRCVAPSATGGAAPSVTGGVAPSATGGVAPSATGGVVPVATRCFATTDTASTCGKMTTTDVADTVRKVVKEFKDKAELDNKKNISNKIEKEIKIKIDEEPRTYLCAFCLYQSKSRVELGLHIAVRHNKLIFKRSNRDYCTRKVQIEHFCIRCSFRTMDLKKLVQHSVKHVRKRTKNKAKTKRVKVELHENVIRSIENETCTKSETQPNITFQNVKDTKSEKVPDFQNTLKSLKCTRNNVKTKQVKVELEENVICSIENEKEPNITFQNAKDTKSEKVPEFLNTLKSLKCTRNNVKTKQVKVELEENVICSTENEKEPNITFQNAKDTKSGNVPEVQNMLKSLKPTKVILERILYCDKCLFNTTSSKALNIHKEIHEVTTSKVEERIFGCEQCSFKTKTEGYLTRHYSKVHKKLAVTYPCKLCKLVFNDILDRRRHFDAVHKMKKATAKVLIEKAPVQYYGRCYCDEAYWTPSDLERHMLNAHGWINKVNCLHCMHVANSPRSLEEHLKTHVRYFYRCSVCEFVSPNNLEESVREHIRQEHSLRKFECPKCFKIFRSKDSLKDHILCHKKEQNKSLNVALKASDIGSEKQKITLDLTICKSNVCKFCNLKCSNENELKEHIKEIHDKSYKCEFCEYVTNKEYSLTQHLEIVHRIYSKKNLENDFVRTNVTAYSCKYCEHVSLDLEKFKNHLNTEHCQNLFPCKICSENFQSEEGRKHHIISVHKSSKKIFKCEICDFVPTRGINGLREHMYLNHNSNFDENCKTFSCDFCVFKSDNPTSVMMHCLKIHKKNLPFLHSKLLKKRLNCPFCNFTSVTKLKLQKHIIYKHTPSSLSDVKEEIIKPEREESSDNSNSSSSNQELKMRIKLKDVENAEKYYCPMRNCPHTGFFKKSSVNIHLRNKHKIKWKYRCNECDFGTNRLGTLNVHRTFKHKKNSNLEDKSIPFECKLCEKQFTTIYSFLNHLENVHHDSAKFHEYKKNKLNCKYCSFTSNKIRTINLHAVREHVRVYTGDEVAPPSSPEEKEVVKKNYVYNCDDCDFKTNKFSSFNRHALDHVHVNDDIFNCPHCDQNYNEADLLQKHLSSKHMINKSTLYIAKNYCNKKKS